MNLVIGSRGSDLALYQASLIRHLLSNSGIDAQVRIIKTTGDKIDNLSFDKIEGKGFFTKELEEALLAGEIDLAVHSLKDLSTELPHGLKIGAYCNPENPCELLLIRPDKYDPEQKLFLKTGAVIGTSSVRRQAQIAFHRPDLIIEPLRGNVPTRVRKLKEGEFDAILIARAGVERLKLGTGDLRVVNLDKFEFIPAPGQGILAVEIRDNDPEVEKAVARLNDSEAEITAILERGLLARFQGGCQLPLAVTSIKKEGGYHLKAFLGKRIGDRWGQPAIFTVDGNNPTELIDRAYTGLTNAARRNMAIRPRKILITRSEADGAEFFKSFSEEFEIIFYPVFDIIPGYNGKGTAESISHLDEFDWLIFTSKNAVRIFIDILERNRLRIPAGIKIASIGSKTTALLRSLGFNATFTARQEDSSGLIRELKEVIGKRVVSILLPQGEEAPDNIEKGLISAGYGVKRINIYKTIPTMPELLPEIDSRSVEYFIFTSPLSVKYYKQLGHVLADRSWISAIGRPTAEALAEYYRTPDYVPARADIADIVEKIREQI